MVKTSTIIAVVVLGAVGVIAYLFLGSKGSGPSLSTPQTGQVSSYPSASSMASGAGSLSVSEVYNYAPSSISESTHTYQTTISPTIKTGLFNS